MTADSIVDILNSSANADLARAAAYGEDTEIITALTNQLLEIKERYQNLVKSRNGYAAGFNAATNILDELIETQGLDEDELRGRFSELRSKYLSGELEME
ncbi:MAG: hypothetical protein CL942_04215 [Desulfovibrio sp.]|nr:hypothetical protein [Desulfovibrio sp.]|tara:strand:- start:184 stop:483 length:300 start_codon:yes stop_codon:yes gene_type:complete